MEQINKLMYAHHKEKLLRVSGSIGSEAGVMRVLGIGVGLPLKVKGDTGTEYLATNIFISLFEFFNIFYKSFK